MGFLRKVFPLYESHVLRKGDNPNIIAPPIVWPGPTPSSSTKVKDYFHSSTLHQA